ncbi:hypothetical protein N9Q18_00300 [bacterium]|nr:hypothetical protein [bacterium]
MTKIACNNRREARAGEEIVRFDVAGTSVFVVAAIAVAVIFDGAAMTIAAVVAVLLLPFFLGTHVTRTTLASVLN